ncbi:MAG: NHLP bacteriocin system secretion protein [Geitlerinemataceae cyanobacterium]
MFNRGIFRKEALERLSSPEQLDQLMYATGSMSWLFLLSLGALVASGAIWSVVARIPVTVEGRGIFIQPSQVVPVQSPIAGQLQNWEVDRGTCVEAGDILATLDPVELRNQLSIARQQLRQVSEQNQQRDEALSQRVASNLTEIDAQRRSLNQQLRTARSQTPELQQAQLAALDDERRDLRQRLRDTDRLVVDLQERFERRQEIQEAGAIAADAVLQAEQEFISMRQTLSELEAQLAQLDARETEIRQQYQTGLDSAGELEAQLAALDAERDRLLQESTDRATTDTKETQAIARDIEQLERDITKNSLIRSPASGCLIEQRIADGQVLQAGSQLGRLQYDTTDASLVAIGYFAVADGKRIEPTMPIQVTPDTVQRERFGGIIGEVERVSELPVTREGVALTVGNAEVAANLTAPQPGLGQDPAEAVASGAIEVIGQLQPSDRTISGWEWSSSAGPALELTSGTTFTARVEVEERAPITFVLPILREWTGVY